MQHRVLITGGARGIGAACVEAFYQAGWQVALSFFRSEDAASAMREDFPGLLAFPADLSYSEQADRLVERAVAAMGGLDLLVNNAGVAQQKLLTDVSDAEWDAIFDVNVKGTFFCCRAALPHMIRRQRGGIINISSMWGQIGASCEVPYSAAKAAVIGLTKALAKEVGPSGIRVNCVAPGVIATDMIESLSVETLGLLREETPLGVIGRAEDVARAVLYLASDNAAFITGQVLGVNGGMVV